MNYVRIYIYNVTFFPGMCLNCIVSMPDVRRKNLDDIKAMLVLCAS